MLYIHIKFIITFQSIINYLISSSVKIDIIYLSQYKYVVTGISLYIEFVLISFKNYIFSKKTGLIIKLTGLYF